MSILLFVSYPSATTASYPNLNEPSSFMVDCSIATHQSFTGSQNLIRMLSTTSYETILDSRLVQDGIGPYQSASLEPKHIERTQCRARRRCSARSSENDGIGSWTTSEGEQNRVSGTSIRASYFFTKCTLRSSQAGLSIALHGNILLLPSYSATSSAVTADVLQTAYKDS